MLKIIIKLQQRNNLIGFHIPGTDLVVAGFRSMWPMPNSSSDSQELCTIQNIVLEYII